MRGVNFEDQLGQPCFVVLAATAPAQGADPRQVVAAIGDQDPAQQSCAEAITPRVDERETLARHGLVDQRLRRLAQHGVLALQTRDLPPATAKFLAQFGGSGGEATAR